MRAPTITNLVIAMVFISLSNIAPLPARAQYGLQQAAAGIVRSVNRAQRQNSQRNRQQKAMKQQQKMQKEQAKMQEKQMKLQARLQDKQMKLQAKLQAQQAKLEAKNGKLSPSSAPTSHQQGNYGQQNFGQNFNAGNNQNYSAPNSASPTYNQGGPSQSYSSPNQ